MKFSSVFLIPAALLFASASAYNDHCGGSRFFHPQHRGCYKAIAMINATEKYVDQHEFQYDICYVKYATNGNGPQPINGSYLIDTANTLMEECRSGHNDGWYSVGSWGTGNCEACHITIDYYIKPW